MSFSQSSFAELHVAPESEARTHKKWQSRKKNANKNLGKRRADGVSATAESCVFEVKLCKYAEAVRVPL